MEFFKVTFTVIPPVECTEKQFKEWIKFQLGHDASIDRSNPLQDVELVADTIKVEPIKS